MATMNFRRAAAGMAIALALAALIIARDLGVFRKLRHHALQRGAAVHDLRNGPSA